MIFFIIILPKMHYFFDVGVLKTNVRSSLLPMAVILKGRKLISMLFNLKICRLLLMREVFFNGKQLTLRWVMIPLKTIMFVAVASSQVSLV